MLAAVLLLTAAGCAAHGQAGDAPLVRASAVALSARQPDESTVGQLRFEAGFSLSSPDRRFGGLSGLWIAADGSELIAASDRGPLWRAGLSHTPDGRLAGFANWRVLVPGRLPDDPTTRGGSDAEALAGLGADGLVVAYEGGHRLRLFARDDLEGTPLALPRPPELATWSNRGMEALASLSDDTLLAFGEGIHDAQGDILAWRIRADGTDRLGYAPVERFAPTGADRLDGVIYVVERRFTLLGGFRTRIAAFPAQEASSKDRVVASELARLGPPLLFDNFEAIAARRAPDGRVLLYLLADDNFSPLQRTLLLQFSYDDGALQRRPRERIGPAHEGAEG